MSIFGPIRKIYPSLVSNNVGSIQPIPNANIFYTDFFIVETKNFHITKNKKPILGAYYKITNSSPLYTTTVKRNKSNTKFIFDGDSKNPPTNSLLFLITKTRLGKKRKTHYIFSDNKGFLYAYKYINTSNNVESTDFTIEELKEVIL